MNNNKGDNVSYYMKENTRAILFHPYTWLVAIDGESEPRIISPECTEEEAKTMVAALNARFYPADELIRFLEDVRLLTESACGRVIGISYSGRTPEDTIEAPDVATKTLQLLMTTLRATKETP